MNPKAKSLLTGLGLGVVYGLFLRILGDRPETRTALTVMSLGFLVFGPLVIGWISVRGLKNVSLSPLQSFFWPFIPLTLGCLTTLLFKFEGLICVIMYLPAGLILAGVGGLLARASVIKSGKPTLAILFLPFAAHWMEGQLQFPTEFHTVKNTIEIRGSAASVWKEIKSVKTISQAELKDSWVHKMGFPRPLDAEIDHESIGGIRTARFERGLVFKETVNEWTPNKRLSFQIDVDPSEIPPTALDEHVTIGGPFFDVLQGTYEIEEINRDKVILHLQSQFRLSTHFNSYAAQWTDLIMHQIQSDILSVIKARAEQVQPRD